MAIVFFCRFPAPSMACIVSAQALSAVRSGRAETRPQAAASSGGLAYLSWLAFGWYLVLFFISSWVGGLQPPRLPGLGAAPQPEGSGGREPLSPGGHDKRYIVFHGQRPGTLWPLLFRVAVSQVAAVFGLRVILVSEGCVESSLVLSLGGRFPFCPPFPIFMFRHF